MKVDMIHQGQLHVVEYMVRAGCKRAYAAILVSTLIAAAREEAAEQGVRKERRRLKASRVVGYDRTEPPYSGQLCYCIPYKAFSPRPASALSPAPKEIDNGH